MITEPNFRIEMWYYVCDPTDFYLFCVEETDRNNGAFYTVDEQPHICIFVDGNGYYNIEMRLEDNEFSRQRSMKSTTN